MKNASYLERQAMCYEAQVSKHAVQLAAMETMRREIALLQPGSDEHGCAAVECLRNGCQALSNFRVLSANLAPREASKCIPTAMHYLEDALLHAQISYVMQVCDRLTAQGFDLGLERHDGEEAGLRALHSARELSDDFKQDWRQEHRAEHLSRAHDIVELAVKASMQCSHRIPGDRDGWPRDWEEAVKRRGLVTVRLP